MIVENKLGKASGARLFYNYLLEKRYITRTFLDELVEIIRQYDIWEWYTKYKNKKVRVLHILFEEQGYKIHLND